MPYKKNNIAGRKRRATVCRIGPLIVNTITPICQQNGFVQARILLEWDYIVTSQFSQFCVPLKVTFPLKQRSNGRLLVRTTSSMATEIAYLEPLILNRINQYFGYQAISKISLLQGPIPKRTFSKTQRRQPIGEKDHATLSAHVHSVKDERLRAALLSLGVGLTQRKNHP